ncbi:hypothetical protein R1sor_008425 [Riccia sorocarpa]|uniref:Glucan endo-1,3-beta-D-glucosidase n=1 Tax=Riccia sorocarpa TaxID=122646 RepID=A0ABD3HZL2_9MARC
MAVRNNILPVNLVFKFILLASLITENIDLAGAWLGVNFGEDGDNLPSRTDVVKKLTDIGMKQVRIYHTYAETMSAFANSGIDLIIGISNDDFMTVLADVNSSLNWLNTNVVPYPNTNVVTITVGNEVFASDSELLIAALLPSMENLYSALQQLALDDITVTTAHAFDVMGVSYPPSAGAFKSEYLSTMTGIAEFLSRTGSFVFVNFYPYFTYEADKTNVQLSYALLGSGYLVDSGNGKVYINLLAQAVDAVYTALTAVGYGDLVVRVSEIGWPSGGGDDATVANAQTHNQNLVALVEEGTPLKPDNKVDAFLFAMFNENLKAAGVEQNWGLYYPNLTEVYHIDF